MKFRFHVISLPHTQTTAEYVACAYTQKVIKFCRMMKSLGHEVYLYASEENEAPCDELITIVNKKEQRQWFGEYDFKHQFFKIEWKENLPYWTIPNARAITEIKKRAKARDFICIIGGLCQKQISDGLPELTSVEYGIGYYGVYAPFRVYESYAQMNYVHGEHHDDNGRSFDAVIPNYFDPADFKFSAKKDDYFLYIGRLISRKGIRTAIETINQLNKQNIEAKLVLVGQGDINQDGSIEIDGPIDDHDISKFLYLGYAGMKKRNELMSRAKATFVMTDYIEPFGGTSIEPMFCGTPVITTDWGAFPENIIHGKVGYRTRTLGEALWAAKNLDKLLPAKDIRKYAIDNFSLDRVKYLYQAYFEQLYTLWDENGWYSNWDKGVSKYNRYGKYYPV